MKTKLIIVGVFALAVIIILIVTLAGGKSGDKGDGGPITADSAKPPPPAGAVEILPGQDRARAGDRHRADR